MSKKENKERRPPLPCLVVPKFSAQQAMGQRFGCFNCCFSTIDLDANMQTRCNQRNSVHFGKIVSAKQWCTCFLPDVAVPEEDKANYNRYMQKGNDINA